VFVYSHSRTIRQCFARQIGGSNRLQKGLMNTSFDATVKHTCRRHGDNLPIDKLSTPSLALAIAPSEVFVDCHGAANGDVHAVRIIMERDLDAK